MKKLLMAMVLTPLMAIANTEVVDGVTWTYTINDGKAQVGAGSFRSPAISSLISGAITIPSRLGGYPVTSVGDYAFDGCSGLTSVTIPSSVTSIGNRVFNGCSGLVSVTIPEGVTSIGDYAFFMCDGLMSVTIPPSVKIIGEQAFCHCDGLTAVTIPSTSIGEMAFYSCGSLTSVTILSSVMSIGDRAFGFCDELTSISVEEDNPSYSSQSGILYNKAKSELICCPGGKTGTVTMPMSVTSIGKNAFYRCTRLTSVVIPESVTSIGETAFHECQRLTLISVEGDNPSYSSQSGILYNKTKSDLICCPAGKVGAMEVPSSVTSIGDYAFELCTRLTTVTIPPSVTSIGDCAFSCCRELTSVTIPSSVRSIGEMAFSDCIELTSVTIPPSVTSIEMGTFIFCTGLTSVSIPSSVTNIGGLAFEGCSGLKVVYVGKDDINRVKGLYSWTSRVIFVEVILPVVEGDEGATVMGDPVSGFVVRPSVEKTAVEVTIPQGVDAAKVTVEVSPKVASVKPNGAKVKIVSGGADITEFLNVPAADGDRVVDLTKATVKEEIVKEAMDVEKGAKIVLDVANPSLTTPNTRVGLFYQLREGTTLEGMANGDSTIGDGKPWSPEIKVKGGNSAVYSIGVGKGE